MLIVDTLGKLLTINSAGLEFSEFKREEVIGLHFLHIPGVLNRNNYKRCLKVYKDALLGKPTYNFYLDLSSNTGVKHTMIFNVFPIKENKKVKFLLLISKDITEQKEIENAYKQLNQAKNHLNNIINSAQQIIFSIDEKNRITTWNNAMISVTGYPSSKVLNKKLENVNIFTNPSDLLEYGQQVKEGNQKQYNECLIESDIGSRRILSLSGSIIIGSNDEYKGIMFVGSDITEKLQLHGTLIPGRSYMAIGKISSDYLYNIIDLKNLGYNICFFTRNKEEFESHSEIKNKIKYVSIGNRDDKQSESIETLSDIYEYIKFYIKKTKKPMFLLDRIDYFLINETFEGVMKNLYRINNKIRESKLIFILFINDKLLTSNEKEFLYHEFKQFPIRTIDHVFLSENMYQILEYVQNKNNSNILITYRKLGKDLCISKATVSKRLSNLEKKGLLSVRRIGRSKTLIITQKGKDLLRKRKTNQKIS
jgi:PAS domain S-box-containing protein